MQNTYHFAAILRTNRRAFIICEYDSEDSAPRHQKCTYLAYLPMTEQQPAFSHGIGALELSSAVLFACILRRGADFRAQSPCFGLCLWTEDN
jgi:hypothetical protein